MKLPEVTLLKAADEPEKRNAETAEGAAYLMFSKEGWEDTYKSLLKRKTFGDLPEGGLALGFAGYLTESGMPHPDKMLLMSPWVDVTLTNPEIPEYEKCEPFLHVSSVLPRWSSARR